MSFDEFDHYWNHMHGAIVTGVPEFTRHVRRYVQCHWVASYSGARDASKLTTQWRRAPFDGIAELWFDSIADMVVAFNEPQFMAKIAPDDEKFVDAVHTQLFTLREVEKFPVKENMYTG